MQMRDLTTNALPRKAICHSRPQRHCLIFRPNGRRRPPGRPHPRWFALACVGSLPNRTELARRLSPVSYVRPGLPPIIQAHGDHDPYVPYEQVLRLNKALDQAGDPNQLITLAGPIHGWAVEKEISVEEQVFGALEKYGVLPR